MRQLQADIAIGYLLAIVCYWPLTRYILIPYSNEFTIILNFIRTHLLRHLESNDNYREFKIINLKVRPIIVRYKIFISLVLIKVKTTG